MIRNSQLESRTVWDALVIGAGPAGALASRELSRQGMKTLLVEARSFPRDKVCGGCFNARGMAVLESVGLGNLLAGLGAVSLSAIDIQTVGRRQLVSLPGGVAVSRRSLDTALVAEAVHEGCEFISETSAKVLPQTFEDLRHVVLGERDGISTTVRARVVLACDGLGHSSLQKLPLFKCRIAKSSRIGVGAVAKDDSGLYRPGQIVMAVGKAGYVGITVVEAGGLNIAASLDARLLRKKKLHDAVMEILRETNTEISEAVQQMNFRGTPKLTRSTPLTAGERLFLLGDATGYVEPFSGEGIARALTAACLVAPLASRAATDWRPTMAQQWSRIYRQTVGQRQFISRALALVARHPRAIQAAMGCLRIYPPLGEIITRRINRVPPAVKGYQP